MILGRWKPVGALLAALLFGFANSLKDQLGIIGSAIPSQFLAMLPYLATIFAVAGSWATRSRRPPKASRTRNDRHRLGAPARCRAGRDRARVRAVLALSRWGGRGHRYRRIVTGANVENASYGLTLCAECALVSKLHTDGLGTRLIAFACVDAAGAPLPPCGRCRQLLFEHGGPDLLLDGPDGPVTMDDAPLGVRSRALGGSDEPSPSTPST